jgi:N-succinyldiaminopimelate aminotransferase
MGPVVQRASIAAWNDEDHVVANRELYRAKFAQVMPLLAPVLDVTLPDAAFYLWAGIPGGGDEVAWARGLLAQYNVNVLPGRLLAREVPGRRPANPGQGRVRLALVAPVAECVEAARRIVSYTESLR